MRYSIDGGCQADATGTSIDKVMCGGESTVESVEKLHWRRWRRKACLMGQRLRRNEVPLSRVATLPRCRNGNHKGDKELSHRKAPSHSKS
jgi:hypothetical protein